MQLLGDLIWTRASLMVCVVFWDGLNDENQPYLTSMHLLEIQIMLVELFLSFASRCFLMGLGLMVILSLLGIRTAI